MIYCKYCIRRMFQALQYQQTIMLNENCLNFSFRSRSQCFDLRLMQNGISARKQLAVLTSPQFLIHQLMQHLDFILVHPRFPFVIVQNLELVFCNNDTQHGSNVAHHVRPSCLLLAFLLRKSITPCNRSKLPQISYGQIEKVKNPTFRYRVVINSGYKIVF